MNSYSLKENASETKLGDGDCNGDSDPDRTQYQQPTSSQNNPQGKPAILDEKKDSSNSTQTSKVINENAPDSSTRTTAGIVIPSATTTQVQAHVQTSKASNKQNPPSSNTHHIKSSKINSLSNQKKKNLRKGKWTIEEEEYTNKVIQYFNCGLLELPEGMTLRSYLAGKLNCDPMRITKKYAGASCLGKRAYHAACSASANGISHIQITNKDGSNGASSTDVEAAKNELAQLERRFKMRVENGYPSTFCAGMIPPVNGFHSNGLGMVNLGLAGVGLNMNDLLALQLQQQHQQHLQNAYANACANPGMGYPSIQNFMGNAPPTLQQWTPGTASASTAATNQQVISNFPAPLPSLVANPGHQLVNQQVHQQQQTQQHSTTTPTAPSSSSHVVSSPASNKSSGSDKANPPLNPVQQQQQQQQQQMMAQEHLKQNALAALTWAHTQVQSSFQVPMDPALQAQAQAQAQVQTQLQAQVLAGLLAASGGPSNFQHQQQFYQNFAIQQQAHINAQAQQGQVQAQNQVNGNGQQQPVASQNPTSGDDHVNNKSSPQKGDLNPTKLPPENNNTQTHLQSQSYGRQNLSLAAMGAVANSQGIRVLEKFKTANQNAPDVRANTPPENFSIANIPNGSTTTYANGNSSSTSNVSASGDDSSSFSTILKRTKDEEDSASMLLGLKSFLSSSLEKGIVCYDEKPDANKSDADKNRTSISEDNDVIKRDLTKKKTVITEKSDNNLKSVSFNHSQQQSRNDNKERNENAFSKHYRLPKKRNKDVITSEKKVYSSLSSSFSTSNDRPIDKIHHFIENDHQVSEISDLSGSSSENTFINAKRRSSKNSHCKSASNSKNITFSQTNENGISSSKKKQYTNNPQGASSSPSSDNGVNTYLRDKEETSDESEGDDSFSDEELAKGTSLLLDRKSSSRTVVTTSSSDTSFNENRKDEYESNNNNDHLQIKQQQQKPRTTRQPPKKRKIT